jgi:hypothetical protein
MNYKSKYFKYKNKYLKLRQLIQKGGGYSWPTDYNKLNIGDKIKIIDTKLSSDETQKESILKLIRNKYIATVTKTNSEQLILKLENQDIDKEEFTFYKEKGGFTFDIIQTNGDESKIKEETKNNKIESKIKEETKNNKIEIVEEIEKINNRINGLENKLDNHYHVLPTSGIKQFEQSHPYYGKKLD